MVQEVQLAHVPPGIVLFATYYANVTNASWLREQLLKGNTEFEYAFIDASMIISRHHVLAAAFRAINDYSNDRLKSRNIHSEIVFALSPNNNIGEAFRRFGIQDNTKNVIVLKVATEPTVTLENVQSHLSTAIQGQEDRLEDEVIYKTSDLPRIRKVYKVNSNQSKPGVIPNGDGAHQRNERKDLERQALGLMALRGAT